jgi:hypothetical protein
VSISGPDFFIDFASGTWTASVSSGVPPFAYSWRKNGVFVGSGSSLTTSSSSSFGLSLTITDAVGQTASGNFWVEVWSPNNCGGEIFCLPDV